MYTEIPLDISFDRGLTKEKYNGAARQSKFYVGHWRFSNLTVCIFVLNKASKICFGENDLTF